MSCVGVFRKVDSDGESNLVYTLTQTTGSSSSSSGEALAVKSDGEEEPLFSCPLTRIEFQSSERKVRNGKGPPLYPLNSSPLFLSTNDTVDDDYDDTCKALVKTSDAHKIAKQYLRGRRPFQCQVCMGERESTSSYKCIRCRAMFHKECAEAPPEIKHPSHPFHSLKLFMRFKYPYSTVSYHCIACNLEMSTVEAMRPIPYVINHPKSHPHSLTFFPTQASLVCHICGQIKKFDPTYICTPCVFVIHQGCIGYPHVIRNSRHQHRISFTPSLPPGKLSCRLCHQEVDNDYGAYSCSKCDDDAYVVHTKCALDQRVWDGEDLDGVPEEDDKIDDSGPFERIADGIIRHHSHHSHLLQAEINRVYDENKFCEGCGLPVYEDKYYSCMECDFNLHESCAHAPRMIRHPLHPYPLTLDFVPTDYFTCSVCDRHANGFVYEDYTREKSFRIDLRCASITEPFKYEGHKDPLFLPLETGNYVRCQLCRYNNNYQKLRCMECNYVICLNCATLPYKVKYKHDSHFLTISYGKEESEQQGWCEICEGKIVRQKEEEYDGVNHKDEVEFYYKCNEYCCTTAHVKCLLGEDKDMYVKPRKATNGCITYRRYERRNRTIYSVEFQIILNKSLSRLICGACLRRCPFPTFYKGSVPICSRSCLYNNFNSLTWNFH